MLMVIVLAYRSSYDNLAINNPTVKKEIIQIKKEDDK